MAVNLKRPETVSTVMSAPVAETKEEIAVVEEYSITDDRQQMEVALVGSAEVDELTKQIDVSDMNTIVDFGAPAATELSKASDVVLNSMSMSALDGTSKLMTELTTVMKEFDIDEIQKEPNALMKLFRDAKKQLEKLIGKYDTMGKHVDKIYLELKKYEDEIKTANKTLATMFDANVATYHELVKYIFAGEQATKEIQDYRDQRQAEYESTGNAEIKFELETLNQALMMMEQRVQDLRTAEVLAMQAIPMIKTMEFSNMNLVRKIHSAFIITLPQFKSALAQAMLLKRQSIMAEGLAKVDEETNKLILKNAQTSVDVAKKTTAMASTSSVSADTLEKSWNIIMQGIDDTKKIQEEASTKRAADKEKLEALKADFQQKYGMK